jgi:hypothetical protein
MQLDAFAVMVIMATMFMILLGLVVYLWFFKFGGKELAKMS